MIFAKFQNSEKFWVKKVVKEILVKFDAKKRFFGLFPKKKMFQKLQHLMYFKSSTLSLALTDAHIIG